MRPEHWKNKAQQKRDRGFEFRERRDVRPRRPLPPRPLLDRLFDTVCAEVGATRVAFDVRRGDLVKAIVDRKTGEVDTEFLIRLIRGFRDLIANAGFDPEDLEIEFDSPGENRDMRRPELWERFKGRRVSIVFTTPDPTIRVTLLGAVEGRLHVRREDGTEAQIDPAQLKTMRLEP